LRSPAWGKSGFGFVVNISLKQPRCFNTL